jgi:putative transposase
VTPSCRFCAETVAPAPPAADGRYGRFVPRLARIQTAGGVCYVGARGNAGDPIVLDDYDREGFLQVVARAARRHEVRVHAYCLLDDRYELVLQTSRPNLAVSMREVNGLHAQRFNERHGRRGHLFGDRYSSRPVDPGLDLVHACVGVVLAPVRAGACGHPARWRWSSYSATAEDGPAPSFLATYAVLDALAPDPDMARARFRALVAEKCRELALAMPQPARRWTPATLAVGARAR